jgi:hypothetical protein
MYGLRGRTALKGATLWTIQDFSATRGELCRAEASRVFAEMMNDE